VGEQRTGKRIGGVVVAAALALGTVAAGTTPAVAEDEPIIVPWTDLLPGLTEGYDPSSENDCKKGHISCVDSVIREMDRRFQPLAAECSHNAMFSLMYLRTTEEYRRAATTPGFFSDPAFINHQDAVFARYYFEAWDAAYKPGGGNLPPLPPAWAIAFDAAQAQQVSGLGNMMLGMSAHVNRDLPLVLASIGLIKPDGTSRKPDHDKVNQFLAQVVDPLLDEAAARFDPSVTMTSVAGHNPGAPTAVAMLQGWREQAWRNAERLVSAPTPEARAAVTAEIEQVAAMEAHLIVAATAYSPLAADAALSTATSLGASADQTLAASTSRLLNVTNGVLGGLLVDRRAERNAHCAAHGAS
jgi:hypothetical protein